MTSLAVDAEDLMAALEYHGYDEVEVKNHD